MSCYVINTNKNWDEQCDKDMLKNHKVFEYGENCGKNIKKLNINDIVFLYRSKEGMIGVLFNLTVAN